MSKCGPIKAVSHIIELICIEPESNHCLALSLTHSLTYSCFVHLADMTLADKDACIVYSKVVDVFINVEVGVMESIAD